MNSNSNIKIFLMLILMLGNAFSSSCQDSLLIETEIRNECQGQHNIAAIAKGGIGGTKQFNSINGIISDNPIFHFAIYNGAVLKTTLNKKYSMETGLFMEERSFSHGNNTLSNLVFFPKIKLGLIDTFTIAKCKINTSIKAGDFWNEDFQDIIRFYNIDFQALEVNFGIKNWNLKTNVIGDLSRNIGLDLHEMYKFQLQHHLKNSTNSIAFSINELFTTPNGYHPQERDFNLTFHSKYATNKKQTLEAQADFRMNTADRISKAIGIKYALKSSEWIIFYAALRYFDFEFNKGYAAYKPQYRNGNNFIGAQLYPLKNYYRPMNQWAFLTSHQYKDLFNFELNANIKVPVYKKITLFADVDFNFIYEPQIEKSFFYPLYNVLRFAHIFF
jgi:hypothetical protein